MAHVFNIRKVQRHGGARRCRVDDLGGRLGLSGFQRSFCLVQFGFARMADGAVDATGQRRRLGHQGAGAAQGRGGRVDVAFLQHDLAALQVGFGQLTLVGLKCRVVGRLGLQCGQLVFGGGQFAAGQVLFQLRDGRSPRIRSLGGSGRRTLAGAQQQ